MCLCGKQIKYLLFTLLFTACQQHSYKTFVVKGNVKNATHKKVALISFNTNLQSIILDTTTIDANGNFSVKTLYNQQELYAIKVDTSKELWLVNDVDEIDINFDVKNYKLYQTKNSTASQELKSFASKLDSMQSLIKNKIEKIDTLSLTKKNDSIVQVYKQEKRNLEKNQESFCTNIIAKTKIPALQFFYIYYTHKANAAKQVDIKLWMDNAIKLNPQHSQLQALKNIFTDYAKANPKEFLINTNAIEFNYYNIDSNKISLKTFAGSNLLITFWQAKDLNCIKWNDKLVQFKNKFSLNNLEILSISLDSNAAYWKKIVQKDSLNWQHVRDTNFYQSKLAEKYLVKNVPYNVLINNKGKILAVDIKEDELNELLNNL